MNEMNKTVDMAMEAEILHGVTEKWTVKQATLMAKRKQLTFENPRQRSYVWERFRKAGLIDSILRGYPIPAFYTRKVDGVYDFLDGKQRMSAISGFVNNEYALTVLPPFAYISDETGERAVTDITGKYFSELPVELQDMVKDYVLDVHYYDGINERQIATMFQKLNSGKPLSTKDKNIANAIDLAHLMELGEHPMFSTFYNDNFIAGKKHLAIIMKVWVMLNSDLHNISYDSKTFNDIMANTIVTAEQGARLNKVFDMLNEVYGFIGNYYDDKDAKRIRKRLTGELHLVAFSEFVAKAIDEGISDEALTKFFCYFYGGEEKSISPAYNETCTNATARNTRVLTRHVELLNAWNDFFHVDTPATNVDDGNEQITIE